jgi:HSP20 family protein
MSFPDSILGLDPFFAEFDRLSHRLLESAEQSHSSAVSAMPMDVVRRGDTLLVTLDLPGADPGSVDVTVDGRTLTIEARRETTDVEGDQVFLRGRSFGTVRRRLTLPDGLDTGAISAHYANGVLSVSLPLAESAKPRRIAISTGTAAKEISTS